MYTVLANPTHAIHKGSESVAAIFLNTKIHHHEVAGVMGLPYAPSILTVNRNRDDART